MTEEPTERTRHASRARIATGTVFSFEEFAGRSSQDEGPSHVLDYLAAELDAEMCQPNGAPGMFDKLGARVVGSPEHWKLARSVIDGSVDGDLIYATGDDIGLAMALVAVMRRRRVKLAIFYTAPGRLRARSLTKLVRRAGLDLLPVAGSPDKVEQLREITDGGPVALAMEQTDLDFFRPADAPSVPEQPLVVSCGLEQRDYQTLALATGELDFEVKICAASPNFTSKTTVAMPETVPESMEIRHFSFAELRTLYQEATVTVVPVLGNAYSAGTTTMIEAIACGSPLIVTNNPGLAASFVELDLVVGVPAGDPAALQRAINDVLADPVSAQRRAARALDHVRAHHSNERYVERLGADLRSFRDQSLTITST